MIWPKQNVGTLFDIQLGKMLSDKAKRGVQYPYLANFNVRWGKFDLSNLNQMAFSEGEREKFSIRKNDLLMCEGGEIGRCAVWTENDCSLFYQKALHRLRALDSRMTSHFLYYFIQHISTMGDLPKLVGETSIAHLTREKLFGLSVPVPPRGIQDRIVGLLLCWDTAVEKVERLIATKSQRLSYLREHHLTKPKQSRRVKLNAVTHESTARNGKRLGRDAIMAVTKKIGMRPMREETIAAVIDRYKVVRPKAFAYNPMRLNIGSIAMSSFDEDVLVSPDYVVFECDEATLLPGYLNHLRHTRLWANHFETAGSGGVRIRIYYDDLGVMAFSLPSLAEQKCVLAVLDGGVLEVETLERYLAALKTQKRGLMQKLLTGQWRLKLAEAKAA